MSVRLAGLLDLQLAWRRVKTDISDRVFLRHPYDVQLIEQDLDSWLDAIRISIRNDTYNPGPMFVCDVPKEKGHVRPGSHLSLTDRVVYAAIVGASYERIHRALAWSQGSVDFAYRLSSVGRPKWVQNQFVGWQEFRNRSLAKIDEGIPYVIIADVSGFYENIEITVLIGDLRQAGVDIELLNLMSGCLNRWCQVPGRGIPQGQTASDILAKVYLNSVDHNIGALGYQHFRYVDDFRVFCRNSVEAKQALMRLAGLLRKRGLNLQSAKSEIHRADTAREIIEGVRPIVNALRDRFISQIAVLVGGDPYMSMTEAENALAENPEDTPIEIIQETYRAYFIEKEEGFDKTLFRFLLKRLGKSKDTFAVEHCTVLLQTHPEETETILRYFGQTESVNEVLPVLLEFLNSPECVYTYQSYQILCWLSETGLKALGELLTLVRQLAFDAGQPWYVRSVCRKLLGDYGVAADLERLEDAYAQAGSPLEQSEIMCALHGMEAVRRNAFLTRAEGDNEMTRRAAALVRGHAAG